MCHQKCGQSVIVGQANRPRSIRRDHVAGVEGQGGIFLLMSWRG
jgi:hypothetical protein